ncbi:PQQ-binding-like beta-propeller repeat protein [Embleya sp. NBC_00896]|uniref:outer membrane protein assembly factor BamB family protein n=1 Tax=Embleya sp. NBC_00896 TaxID=2975961 RepID=UPI002F906FE3|nr:PQQ-binding-like beta-propeller repeat protein [Embleya sp. NBC_00896]
MPLPQGTVRWTFDSYGTTAVTPAFGNGRLYVGGAAVSALDAATGRVLWEYQTADIADCTPVVADRTVFATGGDLVALDADTGRVRWHRPPGPDGGFHHADHADGLVVSAVGPGSVCGVDAATEPERSDADGAPDPRDRPCARPAPRRPRGAGEDRRQSRVDLARTVVAVGGGGTGDRLDGRSGTRRGKPRDQPPVKRGVPRTPTRIVVAASVPTGHRRPRGSRTPRAGRDPAAEDERRRLGRGAATRRSASGTCARG